MSIYKPNEFAKLVGVSVKTLQRWDRDGVLKAHRSPTNRRYYTDDQVDLTNSTGIIGAIRSIVKSTMLDAEKLSAIESLIDNSKD